MRKVSQIVILMGIVFIFNCDEEKSQIDPLPESKSCNYSSDCNDGNLCTVDTCKSGDCVYKKLKPECCASNDECEDNQYCDANGECTCRSDGCGGSCGECSKNYFCKDGRCVTCEETCGGCQKCDPKSGHCVDLEKSWKITDSFSFGDDTKSHNYHATNCVGVSLEKQCPSNKGVIFKANEFNCWVELDLDVSKKAESLKIGIKLGKDFNKSDDDCKVYLNDVMPNKFSYFSGTGSCNIIEGELVLSEYDNAQTAIKDGKVNIAISCRDQYGNINYNDDNNDSVPLSYIQIQSLTCEE